VSIQVQEIIKEVEIWRSQKKFPQEHMPQDLRSKILNFKSDESNREIIRLFSLNNNFFNKRKSRSNKKTKLLKPSSLKRDFIKILPPQITKKPKLIIKLPDGVSIEFFE